MIKVVPPPLIIIYLVGKAGQLNEGSIPQVLSKCSEEIAELTRQSAGGSPRVYNVKEVQLDLNLLKSLNLISDDGGTIRLTKKGYQVYEKIAPEFEVRLKCLNKYLGL